MFITIKIIVGINVIVVFKAHIYLAFANSQVNSFVVRVQKLIDDQFDRIDMRLSNNFRENNVV